MINMQNAMCLSGCVNMIGDLTGREYSMIARNRITSIRIMDMMKIHLNLRHTMNFIVLHGFVNQKKDVSGRLEDKTLK